MKMATELDVPCEVAQQFVADDDKEGEVLDFFNSSESALCW